MHTLPTPASVGALPHLSTEQRGRLKRIYTSRLPLVSRRPCLIASVAGTVILAVVLAGIGSSWRTLVTSVLAFLVIWLLAWVAAAAVGAAAAWLMPDLFIFGGRDHVLYVNPDATVFLRMKDNGNGIWTMDNHVKAVGVPSQTVRAFRRQVFAGLAAEAAEQGASIEFTSATSRLAVMYRADIEEVTGSDNSVQRRRTVLSLLSGGVDLRWSPRPA